MEWQVNILQVREGNPSFGIIGRDYTIYLNSCSSYDWWNILFSDSKNMNQNHRSSYINKWGKVVIKFKDGNAQVKLVPENFELAKTASFPINSFRIDIVGGSCCSGTSHHIIGYDHIFVRNYASYEPTITLSPPAPTIHTALTITKSPTPHSIRQFSETTITISIENTGTTDITDIEITDAIHPSFNLVSGNFPNPKRYDFIRPGETRDLQYTISAKESGTFMLDLATVTYADEDGNIQEASSEPASIEIIPSTGGNTSGDTLRSTPSQSEGVSTPGFAVVVAVIGLLLVYVRKRA